MLAPLHFASGGKVPPKKKHKVLRNFSGDLNNFGDETLPKNAKLIRYIHLYYIKYYGKYAL